MSASAFDPQWVGELGRLMVHSVELVFDADTEAAVRRIWDDLTDAGVRSLASSTSPSNRPHVTLAVAEHMDDAVDDALRPLLRLLPLPCTIGAPMVFGRGPFTLVRLVMPSTELLALHAEVHDGVPASHVARPVAARRSWAVDAARHAGAAGAAGQAGRCAVAAAACLAIGGDGGGASALGRQQARGAPDRGMRSTAKSAEVAWCAGDRCRTLRLGGPLLRQR